MVLVEEELVELVVLVVLLLDVVDDEVEVLDEPCDGSSLGLGI